MRRPLVAVLIILVAAAVGVVALVDFRLGRLLDPRPETLTTISWYAAFAAIVVFAVVAFLVRGRRVPFVVALILIVAAGFVPFGVDFYVTSQRQAADQAESADAEMEFQSALLDRSDDVDARIAAKSPYTADEAMDFLDFAADSDLSWRSLPDHTPEAFSLLEQAITGGILDPNALTTTEPIADSPAVTVTLAFYDKRIRPSSPRTIKKHDWDVLEILVAHGADLSAPDAAALRADLDRTVVLGPGQFLELK